MATTLDLPRAPARVASAGDRQEAPPWRWIGTLFFAEGFPATVVSALSTLVLKRLGVPNEHITFYAGALLLPWILRPLWSPLLEAFRNNRRTIVATEALMALALTGLAAAVTRSSHAGVCVGLFALLALCAATHDMAADGLYIGSLSPEQQSRYVGWLGVAFNAGKFAVQGLLIVLAGFLETSVGVLPGWRIVFIALAALAAGLALYHARFLPPAGEGGGAPPSAVAATSLAVIRTFFEKKNLAWLVALVVLYRLCEGPFVRMAPLLLLDPESRGGLGLSTAQFGVLYGGFGAGAFMLGAVLGGWIAARFGLRRILPGLCAAFQLPVLAYLLLASFQPRSLALIAAVILAEQFAYGLGSIGLKLVMIRGLAAGPYETAHFAFASGLCASSAAFAGMFSGSLQSSLGYAGAFGGLLALSVPALVAALGCARRIE